MGHRPPEHVPPRSLLLVCSTPLIISLGALACGFPVSLGELAGASLGVAGAAFLAADPSRDVSLGPAPSWAGDVVSFGAAAAIVPYMLVGHASREWMPLFMYACPVTLVAAIVTAAASLATESAGCSSEGEGSARGSGSARGARSSVGSSTPRRFSSSRTSRSSRGWWATRGTTRRYGTFHRSS